MRTISLRFTDKFAPECGTIKAHERMLRELGYVWYGKIGTPISATARDAILKANTPRILLIHSNTQNRYWAYVDSIQREMPPIYSVPEYYRDKSDLVGTWFRVVKFENAPKEIMSKCKVASSGNVLGLVSRHSMSPYFIIDAPDESEEE